MFLPGAPCDGLMGRHTGCHVGVGVRVVLLGLLVEGEGGVGEGDLVRWGVEGPFEGQPVQVVEAQPV